MLGLVANLIFIVLSVFLLVLILGFGNFNLARIFEWIWLEVQRLFGLAPPREDPEAPMLGEPNPPNDDNDDDDDHPDDDYPDDDHPDEDHQNDHPDNNHHELPAHEDQPNQPEHGDQADQPAHADQPIPPAQRQHVLAVVLTRSESSIITKKSMDLPADEAKRGQSVPARDNRPITRPKARTNRTISHGKKKAEQLAGGKIVKRTLPGRRSRMASQPPQEPVARPSGVRRVYPPRRSQRMIETTEVLSGVERNFGDALERAIIEPATAKKQASGIYKKKIESSSALANIRDGTISSSSTTSSSEEQVKAPVARPRKREHEESTSSSETALKTRIRRGSKRDDTPIPVIAPPVRRSQRISKRTQRLIATSVQNVSSSDDEIRKILVEKVVPPTSEEEPSRQVRRTKVLRTNRSRATAKLAERGESTSQEQLSPRRLHPTRSQVSCYRDSSCHTTPERKVNPPKRGLTLMTSDDEIKEIPVEQVVPPTSEEEPSRKVRRTRVLRTNRSRVTTELAERAGSTSHEQLSSRRLRTTRSQVSYNRDSSCCTTPERKVNPPKRGTKRPRRK